MLIPCTNAKHYVALFLSSSYSSSACTKSDLQTTQNWLVPQEKKQPVKDSSPWHRSRLSGIFRWLLFVIAWTLPTWKARISFFSSLGRGTLIPESHLAAHREYLAGLSARGDINLDVNLEECWIWKTSTESVDLPKKVAVIILVYGGCICNFSRPFTCSKYTFLLELSFWNPLLWPTLVFSSDFSAIMVPQLCSLCKFPWPHCWTWAIQNTEQVLFYLILTVNSHG